MKPRTSSLEAVVQVDLLVPAAPGHRVAELAARDQIADLADAGVARQRQRAAADELRARVGLRVVRRGAHQAAVQVARADEVIEHLGADHPGVDDARALVADARDVALGHLRGGQAHVAPDADPQVADGRRLQLAQHARERAPDHVGDVLVDLIAVQAADVVGLEDSRVDLHAGREASGHAKAGERATIAIRSRKSGAQMRSATPAAVAALHEAAGERTRVAADPVEVVADRERLRRRSDDERLEPLAAEQRRERLAGEVLHVRRQHRPPARAHRACDARAGVGQRHVDHAAGPQQPCDAVERLAGSRQVLDHVAEDDGVPLALRDGRGEQVAGDHLEAVTVARVRRRELAGLDAERPPAALARLGKQEADPAAQVEQSAPAAGPPLDLVERGPGGRALARLLLDVVVGGGLAVCLAQLGVGRHPLELHVPAARAADDVRQRAAVAVGRRDQARRARRPRPRAGAAAASSRRRRHMRAGPGHARAAHSSCVQ